jgi:DNA mismatch repair protein MutS
VERLIGRVCLDRANPRDMLSLAESLEQSWKLKEAVSGSASGIIGRCAEQIEDLRDLALIISDALVDNPPAVLTEGGIFRDGYLAELDELRDISRSGRRWIADYQARERQRSGIANLKIGYNNVFGYYIEISKGNLDRAPEDYMRKQTLVNAERFITPALKEYEEKVLGASERISEMERNLFIELRREAASRVREIQAFSQAAAVVDVLRSFAATAHERGYVRPEIDSSPVIEIHDGRHPVVETLISAGKFVSNDTFLDGEHDQILIITGPNMAGKSTYLRQVGLIILMAQAGSFVPASAARIGVADRIFTRVGASDNLAGGESTFLVEMNETANILNNCTPRSLILFDEVGRGTSTFDGLSIAWSIVEYLHQVQASAARTLFATHYHELTELEALLPRVKNYNVAVREWNDEIVFLRKILEGGSDQSLGIQVARLAGLPKKVIGRAKEILENLEANEFNVNRQPAIAGGPPKSADGSYQLSLFELPEHPVVEELRKIEVDNLTPLKALLMLEQMKRKVTKK